MIKFVSWDRFKPSEREDIAQRASSNNDYIAWVRLSQERTDIVVPPFIELVDIKGKRYCDMLSLDNEGIQLYDMNTYVYCAPLSMLDPFYSQLIAITNENEKKNKRFIKIINRGKITPVDVSNELKKLMAIEFK